MRNRFCLPQESYNGILEGKKDNELRDELQRRM